MTATCWFHTYAPSTADFEAGRPGEVVTHDFAAEETQRLLELFSNDDWEDGPRCLRELLDHHDDGEALKPVRWVP